MKKRLANLVKYNRIAYFCYYHILGIFISILKLFIKTDQKLILFNSFAGRSFDDSPKCIFEEMKKDDRFRDYKLVWAFHKPDEFEPSGAVKIKTDGLRYFRIALAARVWITNSSVERGLGFKGKDTLYFNTWHGTPIKKMGTDINTGNQSFGACGQKATPFDVMMAQGSYDIDIFSRAFGIPRERFLEMGLPRNDILADVTEAERKKIRTKMSIEEKQIAILYCPTFREYEKDIHYGVMMKPPLDLKKWEERLGHDYVLLIRAHYEVTKVMDIKENQYIRNMTGYPNLNELYIAADVLISDYSSVFFDYSITGKPMFHFTYDYAKYKTVRGLYFDIRDYLSGGADEDKILNLLLTLNEKYEKEKTIAFRDTFIKRYGNATKAALDCIAERIM